MKWLLDQLDINLLSKIINLNFKSIDDSLVWDANQDILSNSDGCLNKSEIG